MTQLEMKTILWTTCRGGSKKGGGGGGGVVKQYSGRVRRGIPPAQLGGLGERCKLSQRGLGLRPAAKAFLLYQAQNTIHKTA